MSNGQFFKVHKTKDFTVMSNYHLKDNRLSLKAKGLLSLMLSLPEDWDFSKNGLIAIVKEGRTVVEGSLAELKQAGYVRIEESREKGRFSYNYHIYEKPHAETPHTENPHTENQQQLNTNKQNTKQLNTKERITNVQIEEEFAELWDIYPRKEGRANALKAYERARKAGVDKSTVLKGISRYNAHLQANKTERRYTKTGATWFNQRCWDDDYEIQSSSKGSSNFLGSDEDEFLKDLEKDGF